MARQEPARGWYCTETIGMIIVQPKKYSYRWFKQKIINLFYREGEEKTHG